MLEVITDSKVARCHDVYRCWKKEGVSPRLWLVVITDSNVTRSRVLYRCWKRQRRYFNSFSCYIQVLEEDRRLVRTVVIVITDGILTRSHDLYRCLKKDGASWWRSSQMAL